MPVLAFLVFGALADTPLQARLLTRDEIAEALVTELSVPQLELELARVDEPRAVWPAYALLGFGLLGSLAGTILGIATPVAASRYRGENDAFVLGFFSFVIGAPSSLIGAAGGVLIHFLTRRRESAEARRWDVGRQLDAIRAGEVAAPLPESSRHAAELIALADERPGYAVPVLLLVAATAFAAGAVGLWSDMNLSRTNPTDLTLAIAFSWLGAALGGTGAWLTVRSFQRRSELDPRIEELKAMPPQPSLPDDYWHF